MSREKNKLCTYVMAKYTNNHHMHLEKKNHHMDKLATNQIKNYCIFYIHYKLKQISCFATFHIYGIPIDLMRHHVYIHRVKLPK
jgi:hypothetical protein